LPTIVPDLQNGRTTIEWTWWRHYNANDMHNQGCQHVFTKKSQI